MRRNKRLNFCGKLGDIRKGMDARDCRGINNITHQSIKHIQTRGKESKMTLRTVVPLTERGNTGG